MSQQQVLAALAAFMRQQVQSHATRDPREHPATGLVTEVRAHREWGHVVFVDLPGRGVVECQPSHLSCGGSSTAPRGRFSRWEVGDQVFVLFVGGDASTAVVLPFGPPSTGQPTPTGWDADEATRDNVTGRLEVRPQSTPTATTYPVVVKPFLDDLSTFLQTLQTTMTAIGALEFVSADAAALNAMAVSATQLAAAAESLKCKVDTSRTNANNPHLSGALQASYADPLGAVNCPT